MDVLKKDKFTFNCEKCKAKMIVKIHWKNSVVLKTCDNCKREKRFEFKNGEPKN